MPSDTKKKKKTARADKSKPKSKDTDIKKKKKTANTTTNTNTTRNSGKTKNTKTITKTKTKTKAKTKANTKVKAKAKPKIASKTLVKAKTKAKPKTKAVSKTAVTSTSKAKPKTAKTNKNAKSTKSVKTAKTVKTAKATKPTKSTKSIKTAPAPKAKPKTVKTKTRLVKPIKATARAKSKTTKSVRTAPKPRPKTRAAYQPAPKRVNDDDDNIFKIFDDPAPSAPPVRKTTKPRATSTTPKRAPSTAKKPAKSLEDYYDEVDFNAIINGDARYEDFVPANIARKMRAEERKEAALERERKEKIDNTIKSIKDTATTIAGAVKYTAHKAKEYKHKHDVKHNARKIKEESARAEESMANESYGYNPNQTESSAHESAENTTPRASEQTKAPARSTVDNYYQDLMHGSEYKKQRADPLWVMPNYEPSLTNLDKYGSASGSGAGTSGADANMKKIQRAIRDASRRASIDIKSAQRALNNAKRYKGAVELSDEDESKIARLQKDLDAVVSAHDNTSGSVDARENAEIIKYYNTQSNNARLIKKSAKQLAKYFSHKYSRLNDEGAAGADTVGGARDDEETNKTRRKGIGIGLGFSLNPLKW